MNAPQLASEHELAINMVSDFENGFGWWLEKLEKNINAPEWLSKVEALLLKINHFGVEIIANTLDRRSRCE
jgi:hypothetical protein